MVLTQPAKDGKISEKKILFPYHYDSHATNGKYMRVLAKRLIKFPYHYGSHATKIAENLYKEMFKFPYHYGSHATR